VSRRPFRRAETGTEYLLLPRLATPILLVPAHLPAAADTIRAAAPGIRGRALASAYRSGILTALPVARLWVDDLSESPVLDELRLLVPDTADVVVRLGRPRPGRAVVVTCLNAAGEAVAVGKLGVGQAKASITAERDHLILVHRLPLAKVQPPDYLGYSESTDCALLTMSALGGDPTPLPTDDPLLSAAMQEFASSGQPHRGRLDQLGQVQHLRAQLAALGDDDSAAWISAELDLMLAHHGATELDAGLWHGDWVAWNQRRTSSGVALWDWEHLEDGVPLGMDYVHYAAQEVRRHDGTGPDQEQRWLELVRAGLRDRWQRSSPEIEATLLLYLLVVNARYAAERRRSPAASRREGWTRTLVQELNRR
jgi:hypothetical protein